MLLPLEAVRNFGSPLFTPGSPRAGNACAVCRSPVLYAARLWGQQGWESCTLAPARIRGSSSISQGVLISHELSHMQAAHSTGDLH